ncbi:type VII secretion-associated serine protease mycosin [Actinomadura sp. DC4]|uniref:type VII secretion-associated serine protease mycosin n=1 Tax=Actinomadura sp. DC4 TaxID=3055069 RepID=UPI0025AF4DBE|nr:type VII secretion-associated serine protease mycosin [Actinomadura sp. DC4]MDN3358635.1 type VII secretion-associated serine protease mycosin [Actinomadura sp. DC4]
MTAGRLAALLTGTALSGFPLLVTADPAQAAGCAAPATRVVRDVPWAQLLLGPQRAWVLTRGGGTVVAVVDTGVSAASPALAGAVYAGRDVTDNSRADGDCSGHGTFVAGLIAARPVAGSGFAGIAPAARILPIRVATDQNQVDPAKLASGIRVAVDAGARVVTVAVGTTADTAALRRAVAYAGSHDALVVASTDAAGLSSDGPVYPAALPGVVAVASVGPNAKVATKPGLAPALAAPGSNLLSIAPRGSGNVTASGSGVAAAFVAGAAALVRDYRPKLTAAQVRQRLETTADHPTGRLPDPSLGYGIVDPVAAVATVLPEESGETAPGAQARPVTIVLPPPSDRRPAYTALTASGAVVGCAGLAGLLLAAVRRGRRRGWRPGTPDGAEAEGSLTAGRP